MKDRLNGFKKNYKNDQNSLKVALERFREI